MHGLGFAVLGLGVLLLGVCELDFGVLVHIASCLGRWILLFFGDGNSFKNTEAWNATP